MATLLRTLLLLFLRRLLRWLRVLTCLQLVEQRDRLLQIPGVAAQLVDERALALQRVEQVANLRLLRQRDAAKLLDVTLAPDVHDTYMIMPIDRVQAVSESLDAATNDVGQLACILR